MKRTASLVTAIGLLFASAAFAADPVKIGLMAPMTGSWASEGQEMEKVVKLLAEGTTILGRKVELLVEDDGGDPRTASLAAQRLATRGVSAVVGTYGSAVTEATQAVYDEASIVQVANGSTAIRLTEKGLKQFLRTCPRDDEQGRVAVDTIVKLKAKNVAILHDNSAYAKGLADEGKAGLEKKGVKVVFFEALTPKENDYTAILTKMKAANPDFVFFTGYFPEAGLLLKQKAEMKWNVPFLGGDATNNPDLLKIAGKAAEGFYCVSPPLPQDLDAKEAKAFLASYQKKFGGAPSSIYGVLAGDGFRVIAAAMEGAKSVEGPKVAAYLKTQLKDFPGLTGKLSFNDKGDRVGEVYRVYKISGGKFALQK
jgi:branched-chain amino acid transport system substrate-binding protein